MQDGEYLASGTVQSDVGVYGLSQLLARSGLRVEVRESSHFKGGKCVSLRSGEARVTAEQIESSTFLLRGEGTGPVELGALCRSLSSALGANSIEHRIELYDGSDILRHEYIYPPVA